MGEILPIRLHCKVRHSIVEVAAVMAIVPPMYGNVHQGNMWNSIGNRMVGFRSPSAVINHTESAVLTYYTPVLETHLLTITPTGTEEKDREL